MGQIEPKLKLFGARDNFNQPIAADLPNLGALLLSSAESWQLQFWSNLSQILDMDLLRNRTLYASHHLARISSKKYWSSLICSAIQLSFLESLLQKWPLKQKNISIISYNLSLLQKIKNVLEVSRIRTCDCSCQREWKNLWPGPLGHPAIYL